MLRADRHVPGHVRRAIEVARTQRRTSAPFQRAAGGKFRPRHSIRSKVPRQTPPVGIETEYAKALVELLRSGQKHLDGLIKELPALLAASRASRGDERELERVVRSGLGIVIENPAGSVREWVDADGTRGQTVMKHDYGYIWDVRGADGEDVDVYLGPVAEPSKVFVVHQQRKSADFAEYDEDKVMLGWNTADDALDAYLAQYDDPRFFGGMSVFGIEDFKRKLRDAGIELGPIDVGKITHERTDAAGDEARQARMMLERARRAMAENMSVTRLEQLAERYGRATSEHQRAQLQRQVRAALGIDLTTADPRVPALLGHFVQENVSLITSLGNRSLDEVQAIVTRAFTSGARHEDVAEQIRERFEISERRARLIARDQIGKINGQINAARQREIGVRRFTWRTVGDERVRSEHQELNGQVFSYDDPPEEGLPGEPINCRCSAEPVLEDIFDELAGPDETGPDEGEDEDETEVDDTGAEETAAAPFDGGEGFVDEEPRATTPKPGETPAQFQARMARNEASRKSKALARAMAKAKTGAPVIAPTVAPTVAPIAATPVQPAPPAKPTPTTLPSAAIAPAGPPAPTTAPKAKALTPKPGETPAQFQARMARNEASRISKARARAAAKAGASQPAPAPAPAPSPATPPTASPTATSSPTTAAASTPAPAPAPAPAKTAGGEKQAGPRRTSSGPNWRPTPPAFIPDEKLKQVPTPDELAKMSRAEIKAYGEARSRFISDPTSSFGKRLLDLTPEENAGLRALSDAVAKVERDERKERAAAPLEFVDVPQKAPTMSVAEASKLSKHLGGLAEIDPSAKGISIPGRSQREIREHLRAGIEKYKLSRRDPKGGASDKLKVRSNYYARGTHSSNGEIVISREVAVNAGGFAKAIATKAPGQFKREITELRNALGHEANRQLARVETQANDYRTFVHEQVHGYGPRGHFSSAYQKQGVFVEEVTTETSARKIVRDQTGLDHGDIDALSRPRHSHDRGSYTREIYDATKATQLAIEEVVGTSLSHDAAYDVLERASLRFKSLDEHPDGDTPEGLVSLFARSFDVEDIERRTGKTLSSEDRARLTDVIARRMTSAAKGK